MKSEIKGKLSQALIKIGNTDSAANFKTRGESKMINSNQLAKIQEACKEVKRAPDF